MNDYLTDRLLETICLAARCGWGPGDLLHVLGPKAHSVLYRAAPQIPQHLTSPAIRQEWLMLGPPEDPFYDVSLVPDWLEAIQHLPYLRDSEFVDIPVPQDSTEAKIRRKIDALLRKAESTTFEHEAEALIAKAQRLRQDFRLRHDGQDHPRDLETVSRRVRFHGPYVKHKATLLDSIARANGVCCLLMHSSGIAVVLGAPEDLDHVEDLFASLLRQCTYYMSHSEGAIQARAHNQTASYRRSFILSYAARLAELLEEANLDAAGGDEGGTRLPVLIQRAEKSENLRDEIFPHLASLSLAANNSGGCRDGKNAAESSHLKGDGSGITPARRALSA